MTLFKDDFEDNLNDWDIVVTAWGQSSLAIQTEALCHGLAGLKAVSRNTGGDPCYVYLRQTVGSAWEHWARTYFRIQPGYVGVNGNAISFVELWHGGAGFGGLRLVYDSGTDAFFLRLRYYSDAGAYVDVPAVTANGLQLVPGRWYHLELNYRRAAEGDKHVKVYADGVLQDAYTVTNPRRSWPGDVDIVQTGLYAVAAGNDGVIHLDDFGYSNQGRVYPIRGRLANQINHALGGGQVA